MYISEMVKPSPKSEAARRASLADVARHAGVGLATASYALRSHPKIPEATRQRVRAAADELGYRVNATVSRLMAELRSDRPEAGSTTLAWINCHPEADLYHAKSWLRGWLQGARARANQLGYRLEELWMGDPDITAARQRQILRTRAVPGLLIAPTRATHGVFPMDCAGFSVATMARTFREPSFHQAASDDFANARTAFQALRDLGYQRIGFHTTPLVAEWNDQRHLGAVLQSGWELPEVQRLPPLVCAEHSAEGFAEFRRWFQRCKPDALISPSRVPYEWVQKMGVRVPEDLGFAHLNLGADVPGWAGIDPRIEWIAASAVDMLVGQIHRHETGTPSVPKELLIKGFWVHGNTVRSQG